nr:hypothetical protein [Desulfogranum marinum]
MNIGNSLDTVLVDKQLMGTGSVVGKDDCCVWVFCTNRSFRVEKLLTVLQVVVGFCHR